MDVIHPRCAGLDVHKQTVVACVRIARDGAPLQEVRSFDTTTSGLLALAETCVERILEHAVAARQQGHRRHQARRIGACRPRAPHQRPEAVDVLPPARGQGLGRRRGIARPLLAQRQVHGAEVDLARLVAHRTALRAALMPPPPARARRPAP